MIYLNNAATSYPKPPAVARAVCAALEAPPQGHDRATGGPESHPDCRTALARLLGCAAERVILTANATHALNLALLGYAWKPGDVVLTTAAEHNSVLRPLYYLQKWGRLRYEVLPVGPDGRVQLQQWASALARLKPRMAVFTHASNVSGAVQDALALCAFAKEAGADVLVDASQTAGLLPLTPAAWGADLVAFTGHKYLLGPQGTGGLYVGPGVELRPVLTGGTGVRSDEDEMPPQLPGRLEAGTGNGPSFAGLAAALDYAWQNPLDAARLLGYTVRLEDGLRRIGMTVLPVAGPRTPVLSAVSPIYDAETLGEILAASYEIVCRTGLHCAPHYPNMPGGTVRFSLSRFTTDAQVEQTITALKEIHRG